MTAHTTDIPPSASPDWAWRADYLEQTAAFYEQKAAEMIEEAKRYRGLAEQAHYLARIGQHR